MRYLPRRCSTLLTLFIALLLLVSCAGQTTPSAPSVGNGFAHPLIPQSSASPGTTASDPGSTQPAQAFTLYADFPTDALLATLGTPVVFAAEQGEYTFEVLVWADMDLDKITVVTCFFDEDAIRIIPGDELFATSPLAALTPLRLRISMPGSLPAYGVVAHKDGQARFYSISLSGRDGSLVLEEEI